MPYVITEACVNIKDRACVDVCPVDCIYEGPDQLYIHPDECIDCGACEPECPVTAIFPEEDVPANMKQFVQPHRDSVWRENPPGSGRTGRRCGEGRELKAEGVAGGAEKARHRMPGLLRAPCASAASFSVPLPSLCYLACTSEPARASQQTSGSTRDTASSAQPAPEQFRVRFEMSRGPFVVEAHRAVAAGRDRFYHLVQSGFYDGTRFSE